MSTRDQYYHQGLAHFARRESDQAIAAFTRAIELDESYADAYMALAQSYNQQGMIDDAITTIKRAIALNRKEPLYHTSLSVLYRTKEMIPETEAHMGEAGHRAVPGVGIAGFCNACDCGREAGGYPVCHLRSDEHYRSVPRDRGG